MKGSTRKFCNIWQLFRLYVEAMEADNSIVSFCLNLLSFSFIQLFLIFSLNALSVISGYAMFSLVWGKLLGGGNPVFVLLEI